MKNNVIKATFNNDEQIKIREYEEQIKELENKKKICQILAKHKIKSSENIRNIQDEKEKNFLLNNLGHGSTNIVLVLDAALFNLFLDLQNTLLGGDFFSFTADERNFIGRLIGKVRKGENIKDKITPGIHPEKKEIENIRSILAYKKDQPKIDYSNISKANPYDLRKQFEEYQKWTEGENKSRIIEKNIGSVTNQEILETYHTLTSHVFNAIEKNKYAYEYFINRATDGALEKYYDQLTGEIQKEIELRQEAIRGIEGELEEIKYKLPTPSHSYKNTQHNNKQKVIDTLRKDEKKLEKLKAFLLNQKSLKEDYIKIKSIKTLEELVDEFIDCKNLTNFQQRIFRALRCLMNQTIERDKINLSDKDLIRATIKTSELYELCVIAKTKSGKLQTIKKIKEELKLSKNLTKFLLYEKDNGEFICIPFVIIQQYSKREITYFMQGMFFVTGKYKQSYFNLDVHGSIRLEKAMPRCISAPKLHRYLERNLQKDSFTFRQQTLLQESGLITTYNNKQPTRAIKTLEKILETMVKKKTLIASYKQIEDKYGKPSYKLVKINSKDNNIIEIDKHIKSQTT